jgi:nitrite reductase/ring-hydroxylating ferredoxin subunit
MLHYVGLFEEFEKDFKKRVVIDKTPVMVTLLADKLYAIQDKCTHLGASLSKGELDNERIQCHAHHAKFDVKTGDVIEKAHVGFIKMPTKKLKTFPVEIKEGKVYVEL